jgi:hypothetical protein
LISTPNQDKESLQFFKKSIGSVEELTKIENNPLYLSKNKKTLACIGSGHFCATYSRFVIPYIPNYKSGNQFDNAEKFFLDAPVEKAGLMRLSTTKGMVYHMGNKVENWMYEVQNNNINFKESTYEINLNKGYFSKMPFLRKIFKYILNSARVRILINKLLTTNNTFE